MPSVSKKQHNLMEGVAHNPAFAKRVGIPQSVGKEYVAADKGKKFRPGGLEKIGKQDTRHGKTDLPFTKLNRFAGMNAGGGVKKYAKGGFAEEFRNARNRAVLEGNDPDKEIFTFNGKKYTAKLDKGGAKSEYPRGFLERARKSEDQATSEENRIAGEVDRLASNYPNPRGRDVSQEELSKYNYRKGGSVESKAMVKKEVDFMKKKGAPASMIKHEAAEMGAMKKGGMMRAKKDIAADQMAMAPYKKGGAMKMARGGGIESRGKTKGTMIKMASGGYVKAADGCASRGKTKGKMI